MRASLILIVFWFITALVALPPLSGGSGRSGASHADKRKHRHQKSLQNEEKQGDNERQFKIINESCCIDFINMLTRSLYHSFHFEILREQA
ncbi:hypothetical protein C9I92_20845 [Photobacterium ganghwense]|uniref:Uncharacterized protein n=1 Tax=Photobacterium ganghwense TaxID=320778 RepID=A0A0J1GYJ2_9GAMM|nr:hypothetical protein ABT57_23250 [Photobacterium ganghwense]PSU05730.1 hypothetical protein C9I92_20845 [Photobacterium ganghwense]